MDYLRNLKKKKKKVLAADKKTAINETIGAIKGSIGFYSFVARRRWPLMMADVFPPLFILPAVCVYFSATKSLYFL